MKRKVVTRSPHREVGIVNAGWLLDHPVEHESHLERRFIIAALSCPVVCDIKAQPMRLRLQLPGADADDHGWYTPDFLVTFKDKSSVVVEVKPKKWVKQNLERLVCAEEILRAQGDRFFLATDEHIDGNNLGMRAMLLMRYGRAHLSEEDALATMLAIKKVCESSCSIRDLIDKGLPEEKVWAMVARHKCRVPSSFQIDLNQKIDVTPFEGDCHDYFLSWFSALQG